MHMRMLSTKPANSPLRTVLALILGLLLLAGLALLAVFIYNRVMTAAASTNPVVPVFSPDGSQLAISVGERTEIYDANQYTVRLSLDSAAGGTEAGLAFSPDGRLLQVNRTAWDAATGALRYTLDSSDAYRVTYSPDGLQLAIFAYDGLYLWDAASGEHQARLPTASGCACQTALAFSAPGEIVSAAIDGVKTWRVADGQQLAAWKREGFSNALVLSSEGRMLAASEKNVVELWDVASGQKIRDFENSPGSVNLLAFSADGRLLAGDSDGKSAVVWEVETGKRLHTFDLPARVAGLAFTPDRLRLAVGAVDGQVRLYNLTEGVLTHTINDFTDWPALIKSALTP